MKHMHGTTIVRLFLNLSFAALLAASTAVAHADDWDKKTTVSFSQAVEVAGSVLPPGTYVMKLVNLSAERHVVQFMDERENHLYVTAMAIPTYRTVVTDQTVVTFYEARAGQAAPIRYWYYPGDNFGQEFVYPREHLAEVAAASQDATPAASKSPKRPPAPVATVKEVPPAPVPGVSVPSAPAQSSGSAEIAQAAPPQRDEPVVTAQNNLPPTPAELPKTASSVPVTALLGLVFLGGAVIARKLRRS
jgi:LPXTG-motif cell wall-anchored protein